MATIRYHLTTVAIILRGVAWWVRWLGVILVLKYVLTSDTRRKPSQGNGQITNSSQAYQYQGSDRRQLCR